MEQQKSRALPPEHRHRVGMRIIKTVIAVFLCGLLAFLRDKSALYSMFAALFCIQKSTGKTIESSVNRVLGTLVGGVVGVLTVYAMDTLHILHIDLLRYLLLSLLLIPIIEFALFIKKPDIAGMACMVVMCLVVDPGDKPAVDSIERLFETSVGVVLACGIDVLLPHQQPAQPAAEAAAPQEKQEPQTAQKPQRAPKSQKSKKSQKRQKRAKAKSAARRKSGEGKK